MSIGKRADEGIGPYEFRLRKQAKARTGRNPGRANFLAIWRMVCYSVYGATSSIPVGGSPSIFSGVIDFFYPLTQRGGADMVTWEQLFAFCMVIIAVISLVRQENDNNKKK